MSPYLYTKDKCMCVDDSPGIYHLISMLRLPAIHVRNWIAAFYARSTDVVQRPGLYAHLHAGRLAANTTHHIHADYIYGSTSPSDLILNIGWCEREEPCDPPFRWAWWRLTLSLCIIALPRKVLILRPELKLTNQ